MRVRTGACLGRTPCFVGGILELARAGVRPADEPLADDRDTIAGVVAPFDDIRVKCSPGVLPSVIANLVRNATKVPRTAPG